MDISYAPRRHVMAWLRSGWRLIPNHEYSAGDWAIAMFRPESAEALSLAEMQAIGKRFDPIEPEPIRCLHGHPMTMDNIYFGKHSGRRLCRMCRRNHWKTLSENSKRVASEVPA